MPHTDEIIDHHGLTALVTVLRERRIVALTGAGVSTESGIPDYRGPEGRLKVRSPVQYNDFLRSAEVRTRYWSRAAVGWRRVVEARPNAGHTALAALEEAGRVRGIITQNVDGLHQAAGSRRVVELHGSLSGVVCIGCGSRSSRSEMQERLEEANAGWIERVEAGNGDAPTAAPDGDADLPTSDFGRFRVPDCRACSGVLKPAVVFFGESVPTATVDAAWSVFAEADALLVVGSSLTVFSGRRFVYRANQNGMPVAIANLGPTRADELATVKVEGRLGDLLPALSEALRDD